MNKFNIQNTPDAFEQAHELWKRMSEVGNKVQFRKSRTFIAGLALKQNRPDLALTILEGDTTYVTMRHIKLLAWAQCGQFDLVFEMLKQMIERHKENPKLKPFQSISVVSIFPLNRLIAISISFHVYISLLLYLFSSMTLKNASN